MYVGGLEMGEVRIMCHVNVAHGYFVRIMRSMMYE